MPRAPRACPGSCNILLIGGGGREHAIAWSLSKSSRLGKLWITHASNAALAKLGTPCPHHWDPSKVFQLSTWCDKQNIDLVIVGPEQPLAEGIADALSTEHRFVFGPRKEAARIESDKAFAKTIMRQASVPTADARTFTDANSARRYVLRGIDRDLEAAGLTTDAAELRTFLASNDDRGMIQFPELTDETRTQLQAHDEPCVIKAAGLAAGKGVIVCRNTLQALDAVDRIMVQREFGAAGDALLVEEFLEGQELSVLALVDGRTIWMLDPCQDHKQVGEGDTGPNTGGMGAYCPTPLVNMELLDTIEQDILLPTIDALRREGIEYRGVLYAGLMLTPAGPKVLEFNCRFGDPECQPLMMRLEGDLVEILWACCTGRLHDVELEFNSKSACCVVMCSEGYPGDYEKGREITGIGDASDGRNVMVFQSGTNRDGKGAIRTNGGRVLAVTALGTDLPEARQRANTACEAIHFDGAFWRTDIGHRVLSPSTSKKR
ncbi:MAG: phosphoribosylamine--glycine ligase [Phycisphaerales bacterium]|nr:phosphoribosylamine--glycine ligase [Phycisphaerales bacterium]